MDSNGDRDLIRAVIRGEADVSELSELGVTIKDEGATHTIESPGGLAVVEPSFEDLALGLYTTWARSTAQREWARLILGGLFIDLTALEDHTEGERVLEMISDLSAGADLKDSDVELITRLLEAGGDDPAIQ